MKLKFSLFAIILFCAISAYAQQKDTVGPEKEIVYVTQVDNSDLINKVERLEKEIEHYRNDLALWLALFVGIITIVSGLVGIFFPIYYNTKEEKKMTERVDKTLERFKTEGDTQVKNLKDKGDGVIKEIKDKKDELVANMTDEIEEAISTIQKQMQEKGDEAIKEVREQALAKAEKAFPTDASAGIWETLSEGQKEEENKTNGQNV